MKELIKHYLDRGISRRQLLAGLGKLGLTATAANAMARSLEAVALQSPDASTGPGAREVKGTGGALLIAQLKAAGVEHMFFNPSSGHAPIFDALVDDRQFHLIKAVQEGACTAMADGYAKSSGKTAVVLVAHIGLPNAMTQMVNSWKDQVPVLVIVDGAVPGGFGDWFQDTDHMELMVQPITKWFWTASEAADVPETIRRAMKFASTPPCGPVFVSIPSEVLRQVGTANVLDRARFDTPVRVRPDNESVQTAARMLLEAKNPLLHVGDELTWCRAQKETVELAELLGLPVVGQAGNLGFWSKPFPTRHPLYIGPYLANSRYPGDVDVLLSIGSRYNQRRSPRTKLVQIRLDPTNLARTAPVDLAMVGDLKLALRDLIAAIRGSSTEVSLTRVREERMAKTRDYTASMSAFRQTIGRTLGGRPTISTERLALELEAVLDKDTCYIADVDSGKTMDNLLSFGGSDKQYFATTPAVLGWGVPAACGVKLANPDLPVVTVLGDGSFLFGGPQPLWTCARYKVPITVVVINNNSYNQERNRIWNGGGAQFQTGRDMVCYLGDPDIDYAQAAAAFGVDGEVVKEPSTLREALERAKRATADGRPYLLDVHVERDGIGAASTWYPPYSLADLRKRKV